MSLEFKTCLQQSLLLIAIPQSYCGFTFSQEIVSTNCIEVIGKAKLALQFIRDPLQKALFEVRVAFAVILGLFCLSKS